MVASRGSLRLELPRHITLAADMHGCPNRCRHCYLGQATGDRLSTDDLRWATERFRGSVREPDDTPAIKRLTVSTWMREPDHSPAYQALYQLEEELSDGPPARFELLSVYRLARDPAYARWAASIGAQACQDWFYRRRGAYADCIAATRQLQEAGIRPRWQLFITRRLLPELDELLAQAQALGVWDAGDSSEQTGLFAHLPGPDGEARHLEYLRPTLAELNALPESLLEASCRHRQTCRLWDTEANWLRALRDEAPEGPIGYDVPRYLALYLLPSWDVYSNMGTLEPWWRLSNLKSDGAGAILDSYCNATPPGMRLALGGNRQAIARALGNPEGTAAYSTLDDLLGLYLGRACEERYGLV